MTIDEIKSLMKSGDVTGAEAAAQELLTAELDNVQAMILYGTCRQLQGDEATFRDVYRAVKEHLNARNSTLDAETEAAWNRFEMLYDRLDQIELLRKDNTVKMPNGCLVIAVLIGVLSIVACYCCMSLYAGPSREELYKNHELTAPGMDKSDTGGFSHAGY